MNKKQRLRDGKLVLVYQSGNREALPILVKHWHKTFCEKAYWLVKDADVAKDIAQDSWSTIIAKIGHLKNPESFGSWALQIVYTKSLDWINKCKAQQKSLEAYKYERDVLDRDHLDANNLKKQLLLCVKGLPEKHQSVIRLFYVEGYSLKDISHILNISVGTTKSRLFHAREKLKQILKHKDYEK